MNEIQTRYKKQIEEIVEVCNRAGEMGYGASSGGNVSYRVEDDLVLITPTSILKRKMKFEYICAIDMKGNVIYAPEGMKPTGEWFMHVHIMDKRPDVKGIMHAHPPMLIGISMSEEAQRRMSLALLPDTMTMFGPVITISYVEPNSEELGYSFDPYIQKANGFIMENHGCLVCSINGVLGTVEAVQVMESMAKSVAVARIMGEDLRVMTPEEIEGLDGLLAIRGEHLPGAKNYYESMSAAFSSR